MRLDNFFRDLKTKIKDCHLLGLAEKPPLNIIDTNHITRDNLGLNMILSEMIQDKTFEIIGCSGFRKVRHCS